MSRGHRAAIYARISEDATGRAAGVERQLHDARALADIRGWDVVAELSDNDISATQGKPRPGYAELLRRVQAGEFDRLIVFQSSRLWRNRRERAEGMELLARARVSIASVKGNDIDLSTAGGRAMAGIEGEFNTWESDVKGERVAAAAAARARNGQPNGGLGYGWQRTDASGYVEHPEQAAVVRQITDRLLEGETLRGITGDLNTRGVRPPGAELRFTRKGRAHGNDDGVRWNKTSVKKLALRASNAGVRIHHRGRPDEQAYAGTWPALVPRERWEQVRGLLTAPERAVTRPGARQHLLTWGIGYCGVCGSVLRTAMKGSTTHGAKRRLYICDAKGCVGRNEAAVDELVTAVVIERLSRPDALDWLAGDDERAAEAADRVRGLTARLDGAADRYADGKISAGQLERITARLRPQITAADAERARHAPAVNVETLGALAGPEARRRWAALTVTQRRGVLETLGIVVYVDRVARRGPGFDPETVRIEWKAAKE